MVVCWCCRCVLRPTVDQPPLSDVCQAYYTDLGNVRLFRLWMTLYIEAETTAAKRAQMLQLEDGNFCCGWGPPLSCLNVS